MCLKQFKIFFTLQNLTLHSPSSARSFNLSSELFARSPPLQGLLTSGQNLLLNLWKPICLNVYYSMTSYQMFTSQSFLQSQELFRGRVHVCILVLKVQVTLCYV